jgi:hypothetical protein
MKFGYNSKQFLAGLTFGFLVVTGTYNAVVINSESVINGSQYRLAKRLDEVYGIVPSNRDVANTMAWQKLSVKQAAIYKSQLSDNNLRPLVAEDSKPAEVVAQAAVQEDLNLNLTGVINPKKWAQGLNNTEFNGSLSTNQGVIESLSVSLPKGEGISVSFSEMTGNVFEYDYEGELYSGMMYQENQNSYVVTLTNGPLEGTRLTFTSEASVESDIQQEDSQRTLAENNDAEAGSQQEQASGQEVGPGPEVAQQNQELAPPDQVQPENLEAQDIYAQEQSQYDQNLQQAQGYNPEQTQAAL